MTTIKNTVITAMRDGLKKTGDKIVLEDIADAGGMIVPARQVQITVAQVVPKEWHVTTKRNGDAIQVWRLA